MTRWLACAALCLLSARALAEPRVAEGTAPVIGSDVDAARTRAVDEALRRAVGDATMALVPAEASTARADVIRKRILRAARGYVSQFRVLDEGEAAGSYRVQVEATIAEELLRRDLTQLGLLGAARPVPPSREGQGAVAAAPRLVLLVSARQGGTVWTTFGEVTEDLGPVVEALEEELRSRGFEVLLARGQSVPPAEPGVVGPLADAQAASLAAAVGASGAVVGSVELVDAGPIRGTRLVGAEARGGLRVLAAQGTASRTIAEAHADGTGYGPSQHLAVRAAASSGVRSALGTLSGALAASWPRSGAVVTVRVRADRAAHLTDLIHGLEKLPGVERVVVARLAGREVDLAVRATAGASALAIAIAGLVFPGEPPAVRAVGGEVTVEWPAELDDAVRDNVGGGE